MMITNTLRKSLTIGAILASTALATVGIAGNAYDVPESSATESKMGPALDSRISLPPEIAAQINTSPRDPAGQRGNLVTVLNDGFEGAFPGGVWQVFLGSGVMVDAYWGKTNSVSNTGSSSVHPAAAGTSAINVGVDSYPDNMGSWMIYGPFSMADAQAGQISFAFINDSEFGFDYLYALISTTSDFAVSAQYSHSGLQSDWAPFIVDLASLDTIGSVIGQQQVYLALYFGSDGSQGGFGPAIDDVQITKLTSGPTPSPTPSPTPTITPSPSPSPSPNATPSPTPTGEEKTFQIFNDGNAPLLVQNITRQNNAPWVDVIPPGPYPYMIAPSSSASFSVFVNRAGLADGNYSEKLIVTSNDSTNSPYSNGVFVNLTIGSVPTPTPSPTSSPSPTPSPSPSPTPNPTPSPTGAAGDPLDIVLGFTGSASGGDANSDGIVDVADFVRGLR